MKPSSNLDAPGLDTNADSPSPEPQGTDRGPKAGKRFDPHATADAPPPPYPDAQGKPGKRLDPLEDG